MAQYAIWFGGIVIEYTGYLPTLAAAKKFARGRYGTEVLIQATYPKLDPVLHPVK